MRSTEARSTNAAPAEVKLEVILIPVSDVDRAKRFYVSLGWRLDADIVAGDDFRVVQVTPPGSECSIIFGTGMTSAAPGSAQGLHLVVSDIEAARAELMARGVDLGELFPERRSDGWSASFRDPTEMQPPRDQPHAGRPDEQRLRRHVLGAGCPASTVPAILAEGGSSSSTERLRRGECPTGMLPFKTRSAGRGVPWRTRGAATAQVDIEQALAWRDFMNYWTPPGRWPNIRASTCCAERRSRCRRVEVDGVPTPQSIGGAAGADRSSCPVRVEGI
jgi:catechol 2,3-dioxygenase-like lactoylglutathione lyase family enzyme